MRSYARQSVEELRPALGEGLPKGKAALQFRRDLTVEPGAGSGDPRTARQALFPCTILWSRHPLLGFSICDARRESAARTRSGNRRRGALRQSHARRLLDGRECPIKSCRWGLVVPKSRDDVVQTVRLCGEHHVSITARGGGTSQAGQAVGAGIQLDFSKYMNRLLAVDTEKQLVTVEPGMVLDDLNAHLKPHNLQLPLDLSTSDRATIGGMISNNSSGTRSVIYGKTLDLRGGADCGHVGWQRR